MNTILNTKITDKCAWVGSEIAHQTDWIYHLSPHMLKVLDQALRRLEAKHLNAPNFEKQDALIEDAEFLAQIEYISNELEKHYSSRGINLNIILTAKKMKTPSYQE